jgi:hypothetical protein
LIRKDPWVQIPPLPLSEAAREKVPWDDRIPHPIFALACHSFLMDCPLESGPTGVIPRSHTSGQAPPRDRLSEDDLTRTLIGLHEPRVSDGRVTL